MKIGKKKIKIRRGMSECKEGKIKTKATLKENI